MNTSVLGLQCKYFRHPSILLDCSNTPLCLFSHTLLLWRQEPDASRDKASTEKSSRGELTCYWHEKMSRSVIMPTPCTKITSATIKGSNLMGKSAITSSTFLFQHWPLSRSQEISQKPKFDYMTYQNLTFAFKWKKMNCPCVVVNSQSQHLCCWFLKLSHLSNILYTLHASYLSWRL